MAAFCLFCILITLLTNENLWNVVILEEGDIERFVDTETSVHVKLAKNGKGGNSQDGHFVGAATHIAKQILSMLVRRDMSGNSHVGRSGAKKGYGEGYRDDLESMLAIKNGIGNLHLACELF